MAEEKTRAAASAVTSSGVGGEKTLSGQFAAPTKGLQPGTVLGGRYEILEMLGEGGMGAVYKARDTAVDRLIALKLIRPDLAGNPAILQRFKQELVLARQVTHRNVVRIYDLGEADGLTFITMEYLDGKDLRSLLRAQGKFPVPEAISITEQILGGLQAAHAEGVIHRDLKPGNIMRDPQGRIVVMDFGLARTMGSDGLTQTGMMVGTMEYMSPEQAQAQPVDVRSDLYTVGLILYELLSGNTPFKADSALASLLKRTQERAVPVSEVERSVPSVLSAIVSKCLERGPADRYQSAQQLLDDLAAFQGRSPGGASVVSATLKPKRSGWIGAATAKQKRSLWIGAAAFGLLVLAAALGWFFTRERRPAISGPHAPVSVLVADFENKTSDAVFDGTLEPAFTVAMEGASFITSYSRGQARKVAAQLQPGATKLDEHIAQLVAGREGVSLVIGGAIAREGDAYRVTVRALDGVTGKVIATDSEQVQKQDVLVALGRLAAGIRRALGDTTPKSVQLAAAETYSTASLQAAHEYGLGQDALWAGKYADAIEHYRKSLALDPDIGRAYSGLAVASIILGRQQEGMEYYKLALSKIDRMSEREKYRTRGAYYTVTRNTDKAIEELSELVRRYPADSSGFANLALAYFYRRDMVRALQEGKHAVEISPKNVLQRNNVGLYAMYAGDFDTAIREQQAVLELNPSLAKGFLGIALSEAGKGDVVSALQTYHELEKQGPSAASMASAGLADLALYQGRASDAMQILEESITADIANKETDAAAIKYSMIADANLVSGKIHEALAAADKAVATSKEDGVVFFSARIYLQARQETKAIALAKELEARPEPDSQAYGKLVQGETQLQHGKAAEALKIFKEAKNLADAWLVRFDLGRAYVAAGQFPEADSELELCLKRRGEATAAFLDDVPTIRLLPPVYYYLGRTQEGLKSPAAAASYQTFISIKTGGQDPLLADFRRRSAK